MKTFVSGAIALVHGPSYDLAAVLAAHETAVDALAAVFGPAELAVDIKKSRRRVSWASQGKALSREAWAKLKKLHDVAPRSLSVFFKEVTVKVHLLGRTWCVQDARTGNVTLCGGKPVSELDPTPMLRLFGPFQEGGNEFELLSEGQVDRITAIVTGPLAGIGFDFQRSTVSNAKTMKTGKTDTARILFPHATFGNGRAWLSVHCQSSDGGLPDATETEN